jgi:cobalamin synthase
VLAGLSAGVGVLALAERRLGGFTGDVLGAAGVVTEIVALVVASAGRRARDPLRQAPLAVGLVS